MGNLFDTVQAAAHQVVNNTMGSAASWTPSAGGATVTGIVLFNKPTQKAEIPDEDYLAISPKVEYLEPAFPGLFESVRLNRSEVIVVDGVSFSIYRAERKYDGKTIIIHVEPQ
jgi:hypothetical protein